jgi:Raf kinase inhibitor-like YbhB/YbcL family protein
MSPRASFKWIASAPLLVALCAAGSGCHSASSTGLPSAPPGVTSQRLTVTSKSFSSNGTIPVDYTCDGADRSPQLTWSAPPPGTKSFAIVTDDPDAPGGDFFHWVVFNVRADATSVPEASDFADLGGVSAVNGFGRPGYNGPCPPKFELHSYVFRVFALDAEIAVRPGATADDVEAAMNGHVLGMGALVGTFSH